MSSRLDALRRPEWLTGEAAAEWDRLAPHLWHTGYLTEASRESYAIHCEVFALWVQITKSLDTSRMVFTDATGRRVFHPLCAAKDLLGRALHEMGDALGLSPLARKTISDRGGELGSLSGAFFNRDDLFEEDPDDEDGN